MRGGGGGGVGGLVLNVCHREYSDDPRSGYTNTQKILFKALRMAVIPM